MAEFVIKMADERGRLMEQVERGYPPTEVQERFVQQGYLVYSVKPQGLLSGGQIHLGKRRIKLEQFVIFNQQFLTLLKAGLPVRTSLDLLIKRQPNPYLRSLLDNVRDRVKSGELLSQAFAAQAAFPKVYTTTLEAGEKSGSMEEVLSRYIAFQRLEMSFRKKLTASLVYPTLLIGVVTFMLIFLVTYVVPEFAKLFENMNAKLPTPTIIMMAIGTTARDYFVWIAIGVVVGGILFWRWARSESGSAMIAGLVRGRLDVDGRIDDDEIMPAYYLSEEMKGLGLDWKTIEAIWSGKGYRWDARARAFEAVK
jgi:type IV pilus assembly protein PilC